MVPEALPLIPFLALTLWRFVFTGLGWGWLVGEHDGLQPRNDLLEQGLPILDPAGLELVAAEFENCADGANSVDRKYRAKSYLRRIVVLIGATRKGNCY